MQLENRTKTVEQDWGEPRSRLITWHDPLRVAAAGAQLPGRDFLQGIIDGRFPPPPIARLTGARLVSVGDGEAVFSFVPEEWFYNPIGMVHGGVLCTLLDSAAGCAVHSRLPAGEGYSSIEIKVSFLRPLHSGGEAIEVTGRALKVGRRVAFAEAHARNAAGELVGHATSSVAVLAPRPAA